MTYWRMVSGLQPALTSATARRVSMTSRVSALSGAGDVAGVFSAPCGGFFEGLPVERACWRTSRVCKWSPKVRTSRMSGSSESLGEAQAVVVGQAAAQDVEVVMELGG